MLVPHSNMRLLNTARKLDRGKGLFLSLEEKDLLEADNKLATVHSLPRMVFTPIHTVLVLAERGTKKKLALEFSGDQVRPMGLWPTVPKNLMLPAMQNSYSQLGLHFVFSPSSLGLPASEWKFVAALVHPTIGDFSSLDLLDSLFSSSVPTPFCSKKGVDSEGNILYKANYSRLLRS